MNAFFDLLAAWLLDFSLLASVLLAAALLLRLALRQPAGRIALAWSTWLGVAALAVLAALPAWPRFELAEMIRRPQPAAIESVSIAHVPSTTLPLEPVEVIDLQLGMDEQPLPTQVAIAPPSPALRLAWRPAMVAGWMLAAGLAAGWLLLGHVQARRLLWSASAAPDWVRQELVQLVGKSRRAPGLSASRQVSSAVALGAVRPQIVLPEASVAGGNQRAVRAALAHEWAHIRHGDLWLLAVERSLLPLLAWHPLFWCLRWGARLDRELLADAAAAGEEPLEYAEALLELARCGRPPRRAWAAVGMWEHPSTLSRRLHMIVDPKRARAARLHRGWALAIAGVLLPAVLVLSLVTLRPLTAQEQPSDAVPASDARANVPVEPNDQPAPIPRAIIPVAKVHLEVLLLSVNREKLASADTTLEDAIAEATESRCRREAGLVVSKISKGEVAKLIEGLKRAGAVKVVSRPSIVTQDGREAMLHVGGEAPILLIEETVNGKHEQRVEYKEFGTILMLRPKLDANEKEEYVRLEIMAEQASLLPPGAAAEPGAVPRDVPGLVSHKFKLTEDVKLGESLLVAESPADKKQLRAGVKEQFVIIVSPQKVERTAAAVYSDPAAGDKAEAMQRAEEQALDRATANAAPPTDDIPVLRQALARLRAEYAAREQENDQLKQQLQKLLQEYAKRSTPAAANQSPPRYVEIVPPAGPAAAPSPSSATKDERKDHLSRRTEERLLELDLAEARLALEETEEEYSRLAELRQQNATSQQEVRQAQLRVERAKIQLQRVTVKLEAAKAEPAPRGR